MAAHVKAFPTKQARDFQEPSSFCFYMFLLLMLLLLPLLLLLLLLPPLLPLQLSLLLLLPTINTCEKVAFVNLLSSYKLIEIIIHIRPSHKATI